MNNNRDFTFTIKEANEFTLARKQIVIVSGLLEEGFIPHNSVGIIVETGTVVQIIGEVMGIRNQSENECDVGIDKPDDIPLSELIGKTLKGYHVK